MPNKNNLGFFVLMSDVLSGLSPMIEMEINFYHVFNILDFLIVSHSGVTLKFTTSGFAPSQNLALDLPLFILFVIVSSLVKKKREMISMTKLDCWTDGLKWVSLLKSQGIISSAMRKNTLAFYCRCFALQDLTAELR